jgi:hypothetical protein
MIYPRSYAMTPYGHGWFLAALVFLAACGAGPSDPSVAGKGECLRVVVEGVPAVQSLSVQGDSVTWIDQTGALQRVKGCGGTPARVSPPTTAALGGFAGPKALVLEAADRAWLRPFGDAKGYEILGAPNTPVLLAASEVYAVWAKPGSEAPVGIHAASLEGGASWLMVDGVRGVTALAIDDRFLFYGTTDAVFRAPLDGARSVELISRPGGVQAIAPTQTALIVTFQTGGHTGGGAVTRLPKEGGLLLTLAAERTPITASVLAADGFVYFATRAQEPTPGAAATGGAGDAGAEQRAPAAAGPAGAGVVRRVGERGGIVETVGEVRDACALAVGDDAVFVASCRAGRSVITRLAKPARAAAAGNTRAAPPASASPGDRPRAP